MPKRDVFEDYKNTDWTEVYEAPAGELTGRYIGEEALTTAPTDVDGQVAYLPFWSPVQMITHKRNRQVKIRRAGGEFEFDPDEIVRLRPAR